MSKPNPRKKLVRVLFAALSILPAGAQAVTTEELLEKAPVFQVLLDNSGSSPATDQAFMANAASAIVEKLTSMPMGTVILVRTVGDSTLAPLHWRTRIQKKSTAEGAPIEEVARRLRGLLVDFPKQIAGKEHGNSQLIGGFFDAARNLNLKSDRNKIVMVSDLVERSPFADCARVKVCKLPAPQFDLRGAEVEVFGAGANLPSDRAIGLTKAWDEFLGKAGAKAALHRTF